MSDWGYLNIVVLGFRFFGKGSSGLDWLGLFCAQIRHREVPDMDRKRVWSRCEFNGVSFMNKW